MNFRSISIRSQFFVATFCIVVLFFLIFTAISYTVTLRNFERQTGDLLYGITCSERVILKPYEAKF